MSILKDFYQDNLHVCVYETEVEMGKAAARQAAAEIMRLQKEKDEINIIFAAAVSQNEFLNSLYTYKEINWSKINAFHMDEYAGLKNNSSDTLASFLCEHFLNRVKVKNRFFINSECKNVQEECERYSQLLMQYPFDLVFLGIGDNGHLAFNDPHVADFSDKSFVKAVDIDIISKQQQVNAGNFKDLDSVPSIAYTVTIPALLKAKKKLCIVPTQYKAKAVYDTLYGEISEKCPASILRQFNDCELFLDLNSAKLILK